MAFSLGQCGLLAARENSVTSLLSFQASFLMVLPKDRMAEMKVGSAANFIYM